MINFSKITTWLTILLAVFVIVAGIFAFQWWQVKGELARQIGQNENLIKQVNELQKEIEELKTAEEKVIDETTGWKTYRNEKYGFEIDYPVGWIIEEGHYRGPHPFDFKLYNPLNKEKEKIFLSFYIHGEIWFMSPRCEHLEWKEIINNIYNCTEEQIYGMNFEKGIITNTGIKGYQGKVKDARGEMKDILFPLLGLKWEGGKEALRACLLFTYYLEPEPNSEEIEIFNKVVSSFRFIEH